MDEAPQGGAPRGRGVRRVVAQHPVITVALLGCTAIGAVLGVALLTGEWSVIRRALAGAVAGAGAGLFVTATRLLD
ncbi:MAG: hypothetical protein OEM05_00685 [Myxococcales bacterium]|nr:hypothetical protein [Myxococcales bacterium]